MRRLLALVLIGTLLAGCGFKLRGSFSGQLPYRSLHIALPENSPLGIALQRQIEAMPATRLVATPAEAEAVFQEVSNRREKSILSLNKSGQVREYRLQTFYSFRIVDRQGREIVPVNEINLMRDITFNDSTILAKDQEETTLWRDINTDLVSQILRRLSIVKPKSPEAD